MAELKVTGLAKSVNVKSFRISIKPMENNTNNPFCNECGKTHPWGSCKTIPTTVASTNNTLPAEVLEEILKNAPAFQANDTDFSKGKRHGYIAGATEYAQWKVKYDLAKDYLKELIEECHWQLPEDYINDIKTFLDGK
jgi:hypothetical protein